MNMKEGDWTLVYFPFLSSYTELLKIVLFETNFEYEKGKMQGGQ